MDNIEPTEYLSNSDCKLAVLIKNVGKYVMERVDEDPFESLLRSIISQQLSGRVASSIFDRFKNYYGGIKPIPIQIIDTPNDDLRKIGLSYNKISYIKDLSHRIYDKKINFIQLSTLSNDEIVQELIKIKGIGQWTAEMFLIFHLKREDVLPTKDLGIRKAMKILYKLDGLPSPSHMLEISSSWRPYRSVASWYLWRSLSNMERNIQ
ncbi:MAG TPA: DNA-3-methyladenine glycosylase [Candidatus Nitrosocosmicus sp.]